MSSPSEPRDARSRYRFGEFVLWPSRRQLLRAGRELPLIPRYFDLLVLLLERRHEAVHRREIFDRVWSDVVVSDGALTQAIRSLRRLLDDDPREPVFIRTVSRHGYRFVFEAVVEEADGALPLSPAPSPRASDATADPRPSLAADPASPLDAVDAALERLLAPRARDREADAARREAAETLHALGTEEALRRLDRRAGHAAGRALLRDARWDVPGAGPVPLLGAPGGLKAAGLLAALRLRRALRAAASRWGAASVGGAAAGAAAGLIGGEALRLAGSGAPLRICGVLALVGGVVGGLGAAGVGAGLAAAEVVARSARGVALVALGGLGGGAVGWAGQRLALWTLEGVFGRALQAVGGGFEGLGLGAAAGLGYAIATARPDGGMAAPRGRRRVRVGLTTALACALAAVLLTAAGANLAAASLNVVGRSFQGSQVQLAPLARLLGEPEMGGFTRGVLAAWEGALFGFGLALGLTHRPRAR